MKIVVASRNPAKLMAVETGFGAVFPGSELILEAVQVESGVSEQPRGDEETRLGAFNRAFNARECSPDGAFWVGMEGGLERFGEEWMASAWMVVVRNDGRAGSARTPTLPLPPSVQRLLDQGLELGEANDRVFQTLNSKQQGGAFGLLTEGRLTRGGVYAQTLGLALIPLLNSLWE